MKFRFTDEFGPDKETPVMDAVQSIHVEGSLRGEYLIRWDKRFTEKPVDIFAGPSPATIDMQRPVVKKASGRAEVSDLADALRPYFFLLPLNGNGVTVAQRNVPLQGAINFRDLGGYATNDGRRVRWGRLFRSGHLSNLTKKDKNYLESIGVRTLCDLRVAEELANESTTMGGNFRIEILSIPPGVKDPYYFHQIFKHADGPESVLKAMHEVMRSLVLDSAQHYKRVFEILLETHENTVLINCSAGKERTGICAAMILEALGVPRETIFYDFMLSAIYFPAQAELPRVYEKYDVKPTGEKTRRLVMPLLETRKSYLQSAFDAIDQNYGSCKAFLSQRYGLGGGELAQLRDVYTH